MLPVQVIILLVSSLFVMASALTPASSRPSDWPANTAKWLRPATITTAPQMPKLVFAKTTLPSIVNCDAHPCIALTFDDGPNRPTTSQLLSELEALHVKATFFLVGQRIAGNQDLLQRMQTDGYEVGNHTWDHTDLIKLTEPQIVQEIAMTQAAIEAAGLPEPTLFRPPYGALDPALATRLHVQVALWNEDPTDWKVLNTDQIIAKVLADAKPGGVVDMHDLYPTTIAAVPPIVQALQARGFQFVTVSELLHSRFRPGNDPFYGYAANSYPPF